MSSQRQLRKLKIFADFAEALASLSTCKRNKVGCVIATPDFTQVLAIGYNGVPAGADDDACSDDVGNCGCIHAEMNAVAKLRSERSSLHLVTTVSPCKLCAGLIVNTKQIARVSYIHEYRDTTAIRILTNSGIYCDRI